MSYKVANHLVAIGFVRVIVHAAIVIINAHSHTVGLTVPNTLLLEAAIRASHMGCGIFCPIVRALGTEDSSLHYSVAECARPTSVGRFTDAMTSLGHWKLWSSQHVALRYSEVILSSKQFVLLLTLSMTDKADALPILKEIADVLCRLGIDPLYNP